MHHIQLRLLTIRDLILKYSNGRERNQREMSVLGYKFSLRKAWKCIKFVHRKKAYRNNISSKRETHDQEKVSFFLFFFKVKSITLILMNSFLGGFSIKNKNLVFFLFFIKKKQKNYSLKLILFFSVSKKKLK